MVETLTDGPECTTRSAIVPPPGMLAVPPSQLPSLASAGLQMPPASQPHSKGPGFQQQLQARATPIITPSLGPSTQLLFAPGALPGLVPVAPQRHPQPAAAAEPIEIIGLDDDDDDEDEGVEEAGSEEEESEGEPLMPCDNLFLRAHLCPEHDAVDAKPCALVKLCSVVLCRNTSCSSRNITAICRCLKAAGFLVKV